MGTAFSGFSIGLEVGMDLVRDLPDKDKVNRIALRLERKRRKGLHSR